MLDLSKSNSHIPAASSFLRVLSQATSLTHLNLSLFAERMWDLSSLFRAVNHLANLRALLMRSHAPERPGSEVPDLSMISSLCCLEELELPNCKISLMQLKLFPNLRRLTVSQQSREPGRNLLEPLRDRKNSARAISFLQEVLDAFPSLRIFVFWDSTERMSLLGRPTSTAIETGDISVVRWILDRKDLQPSFHPHTVHDEFCLPPLAYCCRAAFFRPQLCELLLDYGADIHLGCLVEKEPGTFVYHSPLSFAAGSENSGFVNLLLARGASPCAASFQNLYSTRAIEMQLDHLGNNINSIFRSDDELARFLAQIQAISQVWPNHQSRQSFARILAAVRVDTTLMDSANLPN